MQTGDFLSLTRFLSNQQTKHIYTRHGLITKKTGCPDSTICVRRSNSVTLFGPFGACNLQ